MRGIVEFRVDRSHTLGEGSEGALSLGTKQLMARLRELLIAFLLHSHYLPLWRRFAQVKRVMKDPE